MKMTPALQKVFGMRDVQERGRKKVTAKDNSCVVYFYTNMNGKPTACGYAGRALKPAFRFYFGDDKKRAEYVANWMRERVNRQQESRANNKRALEVGDVLRASWGYDQTNIDYYLVTKLIGKTSVEIVEIGQKTVEHKIGMQGKCIPDPEKIIGSPMKKRANGESVKINSYCYAYKKTPEDITNGVKVYNADTWTAYA